MKVYAKPGPGERLSVEHTRPAYVVEDLSELHGPTSGTVVLPVHIDWTPAREYDLEIRRRTQTMYETVLRSASSEQDLLAYLDRDLLVKLWRSLRLPDYVRAAWERQHPELN
ncbi:hypothetical protein [Mycobacterium sp.]|uniref:hypothetical protein n=1 Tax=Mycobacterium sp. TaxID=1785 RepID=UPI003D6B4220